MAAAPKMTERQQLAIALRDSMTGAPTPGGSVAAPSPASQWESSSPENEVRFRKPFPLSITLHTKNDEAAITPNRETHLESVKHAGTLARRRGEAFTTLRTPLVRKGVAPHTLRAKNASSSSPPPNHEEPSFIFSRPRFWREYC